MGPAPTPRRLIVNADDFGRSHTINAAVVRAHREGILTTASLMVNEQACAEAVALAKENPRLGVGLHLTLLCGHSALGPGKIPGLVNARQEFSGNPVRAGLRYAVQASLRAQLQAELAAQFAKFSATGLVLDHVNGHLHFHLHPVVLSLLLEHAAEWGITRFRLTRDRFWLHTRLARGRWLRRASLALVHQWLAGRARGALHRQGIRHTPVVFGLLQDSCVDEAYVRRLLPLLPPGDSELYSHPSLDQFKHEFEALISPCVKAQVEELGLRLIRYQDL